jgi:putative Mg2+ transporter-C (MgtC) family protein
MLPPNDLTSSVFARLLVAATLGALIGLEREIRGKPAGLRTNLFICMGSALFTILSEHTAGLGGDHGRIAAQLIPGIGFIGAGAIIRDRGNVVGLTTAATIFVVASVGMATGMGLYVTALFSALVILLSLSVLGWAEDRFSLKTRLMTFRLTTGNLEAAMGGANRAFSEMKIPMQHFQVFRVGSDFVMEFDADCSHTQQQSLVEKLGALEARCEVVPRDIPRD